MRVAVLGHTYIVDANRGKFRALQNRGASVLLLCPRLWNETDFGPRRFEPAVDLDAVAFDCLGHGRVRRFVYPFAPAYRALRAWRPDVLLAETEPGGLAALQAVLLAASLGLPLVPFAWENLPITGRARAAAWPVYRTARRLIAGSRGAADVAHAAGFSGPVSVVPQVGIDASRLLPRRPHRGKTKTALFVARLDRKKGADVLIDALKLAPDWRAHFVGDGPERAALEAQAKTADLARRVSFAAAVPHEQVPALYAAANAFVLPSRTVPGWAEQFGHVLAWALAAGVPIAASRCGAIPEVVGDAALLFPENDAPALAAALTQLTDPTRAAALSAAGRARAENLFTDQAVARRLEAALVAALERNDADVLV
jgi:glycosyltransferase involved in cell wall biosynthesis